MPWWRSAATSPHVAEEALKLVRVEYEPLPAVTWVLDAMKDEAPLLHENVFTNEMGKIGTTPTNVSMHLHFEKGDVEKGFADADLVIEREFKTASVHQGYIEPQVSTALWNHDGHITIWTSTQGAFTARHKRLSCCRFPSRRSRSCRAKLGAASAARFRFTSNRWPPSSAANAVGR